ncbi:hypothetical protein ACFOEE_11180 [Pseudoalteromonas fenneropenaei]|uniref:T2SS protein K first SAM-like domain-containing protein n=1 Tax=Pseudoalteromonas fenneropenaei TaxID=1737459 RepID=A0ABV7CKA5_9GAMM
MKFDKGIALVQVLIIMLSLTLFSIFLSKSVKQQLSIASSAKERLLLRLELENAEAYLFKSLLSNKLYINSKSDDDIAKVWNFYGRPFKINDKVSVILQDQAGLVNLNFTNSRLLKSTLLQLGFEDKEATSFSESLEDWKDRDDLKRLNGAERDYYKKVGQPRNDMLQSVEEMRLVKEGGKLQNLDLEKIFSTALVGVFNPLTAPNLVLRSYLNNESLVSKLEKLRVNGELTPSGFYSVTGIADGEYITFATSTFLTVELLAESNGIRLNKRFEVEVRPKAVDRPLTIKSVSWKK